MELNSYLEIYLAPLADELSNLKITDIYINKPGEIWVETLDGKISSKPVPDLTEEMLWRLVRQVANVNNQAINRIHPLLSARLPDGARIQIISSPATRTSMVIAIRKHLKMDMSLEDYTTTGAFKNTSSGITKNDINEKLKALLKKRDWLLFLKTAILSKLTILISGGTSSGKTTFLNSLIREIPSEERIILIEDTPELNIPHQNALGLIAVRGKMGEANVTAEDLLVASLRLRPDRIILGELRGNEALTFLRATNTGHPGSLATIHANSNRQAIDQMALLISQASKMQQGEIIRHIEDTIDVLVHLENNNGTRTIVDIELM